MANVQRKKNTLPNKNYKIRNELVFIMFLIILRKRFFITILNAITINKKKKNSSVLSIDYSFPNVSGGNDQYWLRKRQW